MRHMGVPAIVRRARPAGRRSGGEEVGQRSGRSPRSVRGGRAQPRHLDRIRRARRSRMRPTTGSRRSRRRPAAWSTPGHDGLRTTACRSSSPVSTTGSRSRATRRHASSRAGWPHRSTPSTFENYDAVFDGLKDLPHNTVDGVNYGVPHGRGANVLAWNTDEIAEPPTQLGHHLGAGRRLRRQHQHLRLVDLHRRCGAAPDERAAGSRDRGSIPAEPGAVRRGDRPARGPHANDPLYWGTRRRPDRLLRVRAIVIGTTWQYQVNTALAPARGDAARRGLDRVVGHLDDVFGGGAPELHATCGWTT